MRLVWLTFLTLLGMLAAHKGQAQPEVELRYQVLDLDTLTHGLTYTYPFIIRNAGTEPLTVTRVDARSEAVAAEWPQAALAPGTEDTIFVSFKTAGRMGAQRKTLTVLTNEPCDPGCNWHFLTLRGYIRHSEAFPAD